MVFPLKRVILKNGQSFKETSAMSICDRSYYPLDPHDSIDKKNLAKLAKLRSIAKMSHAHYRHDIGKQNDPNARITEMIVTWGFIILAFLGVVALIMNKVGG